MVYGRDVGAWEAVSAGAKRRAVQAGGGAIQTPSGQLPATASGLSRCPCHAPSDRTWRAGGGSEGRGVGLRVGGALAQLAGLSSAASQHQGGGEQEGKQGAHGAGEGGAGCLWGCGAWGRRAIVGRGCRAGGESVQDKRSRGLNPCIHLSPLSSTCRRFLPAASNSARALSVLTFSSPQQLSLSCHSPHASPQATHTQPQLSSACLSTTRSLLGLLFTDVAAAGRQRCWDPPSAPGGCLHQWRAGLRPCSRIQHAR